MVETSTIYLITTMIFAIPWLTLWFSGTLSTGKMIMLLFCFDMALTIEAGFSSNVLLIALLHIVTIPVFFGLIYVDLIEEFRLGFTCFICGRTIETSEPTENLKKMVNGRYRNVLVHPACIYLDNKDRKAFWDKQFRKGIPK